MRSPGPERCAGSGAAYGERCAPGPSCLAGGIARTNNQHAAYMRLVPGAIVWFYKNVRQRFAYKLEQPEIRLFIDLAGVLSTQRVVV